MVIDAKQAALVAKEYFQETKTHPYFLFDTISVEKSEEDWEIKCEIMDTFGGEKTEYEIIIDEDGAILDVKRCD